MESAHKKFVCDSHIIPNSIRRNGNDAKLWSKFKEILPKQAGIEIVANPTNLDNFF